MGASHVIPSSHPHHVRRIVKTLISSLSPLELPSMPPPRKAHTESATSFVPDDFFEAWTGPDSAPQHNDLKGAIIGAFKLKSTDDYVYHAIASVTLSQVQHAIGAGSQHGLHAWYLFEDAKQKDPPTSADIEAYTSIFSSKTATVKALVAFASNAKKDSTRRAVATHLQENFQPPAADSKLVLPPKAKTPIKNPYYDCWAWSCHNLEWVGPTPGTALTKQSHHILPIFYHHFGCVCPSHDALSLIAQVARQGRGPKDAPRPIVDVGSGNGYWTYMLRRLGLTVHAVDNELSAWRTVWVGDTIVADGAKFLANPPPKWKELGAGAREAVLLLVYPQVSEDFTGKVIRAYGGDAVVVAGTQNANGYTAFRDETIASWMEREAPEFVKVCQIPLPSFAGKDEALFIFRRQSGGTSTC